MDKWKDISLPLSSSLPIWPGSKGFRTELFRKMPNDPTNDTFLQMDVHVGTHVESSLHRSKSGRSVSEYPLESFMFLARIVNLSDLIESSEAFEKGSEKAIFFKTSNSGRDLLSKPKIVKDFQSIPSEMAKVILKKGYDFVGIDYLSVDEFESKGDVHNLFFSAGMLVFESLDLRGVEPGLYECIALPLRLEGVEAAPCRVIIKGVAN